MGAHGGAVEGKDKEKVAAIGGGLTLFGGDSLSLGIYLSLHLCAAGRRSSGGVSRESE